MPIIGLQKRMYQAGRIRLGSKGAKGEPVKLEQFRFTSQDENALEAIARIYGGEVRPWTDKNSRGQHELYCESDEIRVVVANGEYTQDYEEWSGSGCIHRCDGEYDQIADAPCRCDPEKRVCKATLRFSVYLPETPNLGVWRVDTHGYYANREIPAAIDLIHKYFQETKRLVPATLFIDPRESKTGGKLKKYIVPVLIPKIPMDELLAFQMAVPAQALGGANVPALAATAGPDDRTIWRDNKLTKEQDDELKEILTIDGPAYRQFLRDAYAEQVIGYEPLRTRAIDRMHRTAQDEATDATFVEEGTPALEFPS